MKTCPKCKLGERAAGQAWCRGCLTEYQRERRAAKRTAPVAGGCAVCVARRAAVQAVLEEHRRLVGDPGLLQRVKIPWLVGKLLAL